MKRILCVCNTYYQLIMAMQLRSTRFAKESVSLILSDHSRDAENVSRRIRDLKYFDSTYYVQTRSVDQEKHNIYEAFLTVFCGAFGYMEWGDILKEEKPFDMLLYYNLTPSIFQMFAYLIRKNPNLTVSRFEEGILSYGFGSDDYDIWSPKRNRIIMKVRQTLRKETLSGCTQDFYCFYPQLYNGRLNPITVKLIDDNEGLKKALKKCFQADRSRMRYEEKYIFFTGIWDFEGEKPIGEFEVVKSIADLVGKEELLIKQHPRDMRDIYKKAGLHVDQNSMIPWEAIQFNIDLHDKVLISTTSGSVLSSSLMLDDGPKVCYVYPLCRISKNSMAEKNIEDLKRLLCNEKISSKFKNVQIVESITDIII